LLIPFISNPSKLLNPMMLISSILSFWNQYLLFTSYKTINVFLLLIVRFVYIFILSNFSFIKKVFLTTYLNFFN
jgi:hypothetical protein